MITTLGECMQHALRQEKSEEKRQSISLLTSIIQLPRKVFQEYTINTVNIKLLHQILSSVCLKAKHVTTFCSFCNWQHPIIWTLLLMSTATKVATKVASCCLHRMKTCSCELTFGCTLPITFATYDFCYALRAVCIWHCNHQLFPRVAHYSGVSDVIHLAQKRPLSTAKFLVFPHSAWYSAVGTRFACIPQFMVLCPS